ncbi:MAG: response regulator [Desulfobacteraceae bacterium]|jgi:PAS domain S-box-containing protein
MDTMIRILHLEDERADAELVHAKLAEAGLACRISTFRTRDEFETALRGGGMDIILADYRLPMYDGMSALGLAQEVCPDVPFIFVSGKLGEEAAIAALTRGATDYVLKENLSRLAPAVRRALQEARNLQERRQAQEALQQSNDLLRAVIEAAPVAIVGMDLECRVRSVWNPGAEKMLGWSAQEVMGKPLPAGPSDRREEFKRFREQIRRGMTLDGVEVRRQRRDGTPIDYSIYASPLHDAQGRISGNIAVLVDITERKLAEKELQKHREHLEALVDQRTAELTVAKDQAEAANQAKSDFLARMSHEIRTPLNAMMGLTHIVLKSKLRDEQRNYLKKVLIASNNLLAVINDILDFSKVEAGWLELERHPFDLEQVMEQLADLFSEQIAEKDLELIFAADPNVPRLLTGDEARLAQVLINLIQNAVKFTERGKIVVGVEQEAQPSKDQSQAMFKFWVSDTGTGIAADELPSLFEPFTQAEGYMTRKYEGSGLGLAICRRLVELMGGRIWAESSPGKGSTFSFTAMLETRKELPEAVVPSRAKEPAALPIRRLAGRRVLVVEDSELNRDVAVALLEEAGLIVDTAENGRVAVDKVTGSGSNYYHAVLMDIQMPLMDGYQATQHIREWERQQSENINHKQENSFQQPSATHHRIPIIALTAHALKGEKEKCLAADLDDYLAKPLSELELLRVLLTWIAA